MIKNKFKTFLFLLFLLVTPLCSLAQEEIEIIGITPFQIIVGAAGFIAVVMLLINAFQYLTSGSIAKKAHNKEKIALLGVFLTALTSWFILFTTNPDIIQKISFEVEKIGSEESFDPLSFFRPTKKSGGSFSGSGGGGSGGSGGGGTLILQCSDGKDNDGDTLRDMADPGCLSAQDNDEFNQNVGNGGNEGTECDDAIDNDNDGWIDLADPACANRKTLSETSQPAQYQCYDYLDNDSDGKTDGNDPNCSNWRDDTESEDPLAKKQCEDKKDNDGDGLIDFPADPGCSNAIDDSETNQNTFACSDGIDNDGDGWKDLVDPGCANGNDNDETNSIIYECSNGNDDDDDGLTDFPLDPGCTDAQDDDEFNEENLCPYGNEDLNEYANCTFNIDLQNRWYDESNRCDQSKPLLSDLGVENTAYTINSSAWGIGIDEYGNYENGDFSVLQDFVNMTDEDIDRDFNSWLNNLGKELKPIPNSLNDLIIIDIEGYAHPSARIGWGQLYCDDINYSHPDCDDADPYPYPDSATNQESNEDGVLFDDLIEALKRRIDKAREYFPNAKLSYYAVVQPADNGAPNNPNFKERMLAYRRAGELGLYNDLDYLSPWIPIRSSPGGDHYDKHDEAARQAIQAAASLGLPVAPITTFQIMGGGNPPDDHNRDPVHLYAQEAALDQHEVFQDLDVEMVLYWMDDSNNCNGLHPTLLIPDYFDTLRVVPSSCFCPI